MVSKVAVMAIVGILAVPILLGYALNLEQTTETDYKTNDDTVNVTQLLQTGINYTYSNANDYQLNTNFKNTGNQKMIPIYERISANKTSFPLTEAIYKNQSWVGATQSLNYDYFYEQFDYDPNTNDHTVVIYGKINGGAEQQITTAYHFRSIYYDKASQYYEYQRYYNGAFNTQSGNAELTKMILTTVSGTTDVYVASSSSNRYADLSAGFHFEGKDPRFNIMMPNYTNNVLLTLNLDSVTDPNYSFGLHIAGAAHTVEKTTVGGVVHWKIIKTTPPYETELYYNPSISNNTYQILFQLLNKGSDETNTYYTTHVEYRYIGQWTKTIGESNYYQLYSWDNNYTMSISDPPENFNYIMIRNGSATGTTPITYWKTPTFRVDDAVFRAMEYPVIENQTFNPADFKSNPSTKISDPTLYGSSITFGGNTYTVKNGNITIGTHDIPVKGLVLSSVPSEGGGYDNKIGNTVISTTAAPSAITFNGKWSASITTTAQEEYEITKTEWKAGSFAWDGIDQNFLMVGLLASLGAFIALGIYARRSRATIWPLLIVCGGAALLFFVML